MRVVATVLSTVLAASGILVYSQSYGFFQMYKGPLFMAFPTVGALLLGGATLRRASVFHVIVGTLLFHSLMVTSMPVVNELIQHPAYAVFVENLPEIAATVIQNGVILYALTRVVRAR
jgi:simple sugar transport system permease protein